MAGAAGPLADLRSKLTQAQDDLTFIRSQRTGSEDALRAAYQRGNDANNRVAFARQNLDAVVKRFQDESRIVSEATLNLESARAEEALARQGLNEFIAHYTDALPEVIVPNGNLLTNPGTPYGNNPSGSPLGAVRRDGNGAPGSFRINNWVNYLSSAYGAGVSPAFIESVNELYPFNFLSGVSGNMSHGTNVENSVEIRRRGCGGNSGRVTTGVVVEVRADSFDVRGDDGQVTSVAVAPCTQLNAVVPNYQLATGAKAIVKGSAGNHAGWINADLVTCGKDRKSVV